jgi:hypothetical protein
MSGSEGGSGKRAGGNAGTAPRPDPYLVTPRCACPSWRWISGSGIPSRNSSTACAWRSWWGAKRRRTPACLNRHLV